MTEPGRLLWWTLLPRRRGRASEGFFGDDEDEDDDDDTGDKVVDVDEEHLLLAATGRASVLPAATGVIAAMSMRSQRQLRRERKRVLSEGEDR